MQIEKKWLIKFVYVVIIPEIHLLLHFMKNKNYTQNP